MRIPVAVGMRTPSPMVVQEPVAAPVIPSSAADAAAGGAPPLSPFSRAPVHRAIPPQLVVPTRMGLALPPPPPPPPPSPLPLARGTFFNQQTRIVPYYGYAPPPSVHTGWGIGVGAQAMVGLI